MTATQLAIAPDRNPERPTLRELAMPKLEQLADGIGAGARFADAARILDLLTGDWTALPAPGRPMWPSDITDDGTPFEYSVRFGERSPELRLLAETRGAHPTPRSSWAAGLALNERLLGEYDVDLSRFDRIGELFAPLPSIPVHFAIWHGAVLSEDRPPSFKVYLNPQVVGRAGARPLVERAFGELALPHARRFLSDFVPESFDVPYLSLDLADGPFARTKVYVAKPGATAEELDELLARTTLTRRGEARGWIDQLTRGGAPLDGRPVQLCLAFRPDDPTPELTLHVPVRSYVDNDERALELALGLVDGRNRRLLERGVRQMAYRPLEHGRSLISYLSLKLTGRAPGVTVYLSPELYSVAAPRARLSPSVPAHSFVRELGAGQARHSEPFRFESILDDIAERREQLSRHGFFARLASGGSDAQAREIARRGAFFVMGFQDVLKLVTELTRDPELKEYARSHEREDRGHDAWFLHDLSRMGVDCGLEDVFSDDLRRARNVVYAQIADVLRSTEDASRLAIVLSLEAAGAEFFQAIISFLERIGRSGNLLYFARSHQQVEQNHEIFEHDKSDFLRSLVLSPQAFEEANLVVERTFQTMTDLFDDVLEHIANDAEPKPARLVS